MAYTLVKHICPKRKMFAQRLLDVIIVLIAIPVTFIASICLLIYFAFLWIKSQWSKNTESPDETYHAELELVTNARLTLLLVEDESDAELSRLNEDWNRDVYREQTCLYRVKATPAIPALDNKICCLYYKELPGGIIIQLLDNPAYKRSGQLNTKLVLIRYADLELIHIGDAGPFFLYNDEKDPRMIRGFNETEKLEIKLEGE